MPGSGRYSPKVICFLAVCAHALTSATPAVAQDRADVRFDVPEFEDFEAHYSSAFSRTGAFTLQMRHFADGNRLNITDIIPTNEAVIVASRNIDLTTMLAEFSVGPYFAWGQEYVVRQMRGGQYDMTRVPLGGGAPRRMAGRFDRPGYTVDSFSPTLAAVMPLAVGTQFELPLLQPRADQTVAVAPARFEVLRRETLELPDGLSCECWVIRKTNNAGTTEQFWVSREAPFIYRWHRDIGGEREFVSDLLGYRTLER